MSVGVAMKCSQRCDGAFLGHESLTLSKKNALNMPGCVVSKVPWEYVGMCVCFLSM